MNIACTDRCVEISVECITACDPADITCYSQCQREIAECINGELVSSPSLKQKGRLVLHKYKALGIKIYFLACYLGCPCELNCLDGCEDCDNPVCNCEVSSSCFRLRRFTGLGYQRPVQV